MAEIGPDKILDEANEICASVARIRSNRSTHTTRPRLGHGSWASWRMRCSSRSKLATPWGQVVERVLLGGGCSLRTNGRHHPGTKTKYLKAMILSIPAPR